MTTATSDKKQPISSSEICIFIRPRLNAQPFFLLDDLIIKFGDSRKDELRGFCRKYFKETLQFCYSGENDRYFYTVDRDCYNHWDKVDDQHVASLLHDVKKKVEGKEKRFLIAGKINRYLVENPGIRSYREIAKKIDEKPASVKRDLKDTGRTVKRGKVWVFGVEKPSVTEKIIRYLTKKIYSTKRAKPFDMAFNDVILLSVKPMLERHLVVMDDLGVRELHLTFEQSSEIGGWNTPDWEQMMMFFEKDYLGNIIFTKEQLEYFISKAKEREWVAEQMWIVEQKQREKQEEIEKQEQIEEQQRQIETQKRREILKQGKEQRDSERQERMMEKQSWAKNQERCEQEAKERREREKQEADEKQKQIEKEDEERRERERQEQMGKQKQIEKQDKERRDKIRQEQIEQQKQMKREEQMSKVAPIMSKQEDEKKKSLGGRPRKQVDVKRIVQMRKDGKSLREIAKETGFSKTHISRILKEENP